MGRNSRKATAAIERRDTLYINFLFSPYFTFIIFSYQFQYLIYPSIILSINWERIKPYPFVTVYCSTDPKKDLYLKYITLTN